MLCIDDLYSANAGFSCRRMRDSECSESDEPDAEH